LAFAWNQTAAQERNDDHEQEGLLHVACSEKEKPSRGELGFGFLERLSIKAI
jgi:hypothetical protein